jgi:hypothetical protein
MLREGTEVTEGTEGTERKHLPQIAPVRGVNKDGHRYAERATADHASRTGGMQKEDFDSASLITESNGTSNYLLIFWLFNFRFIHQYITWIPSLSPLAPFAMST